jgi:hypothetical protein
MSGMPVKVAGSASEQLQELKRRLDEWRAVRAPRSRLPEELWAAAVEIGGQQGLYRTAKVLRLDYAALKKRMGNASSPASAPVPSAFVELLNAAGPTAADCLIELEGAGGGRMRIQMKISPPEVASLIQAWRASEA